MTSVEKLRTIPGSAWSKPCDLCGEADVDLLCATCDVGLHDRCSRAHWRANHTGAPKPPTPPQEETP